MEDQTDRHTIVMIIIFAAVVITLSLLEFPRQESPGQSLTSLAVQDVCREGESCTQCGVMKDNRMCIEGVCDASGNCLLPAPEYKSTHSETGPRALVLS